MFTEIKKIIPIGNDMYIQANLIGGKAEPIKLAWMYMSLPVGIIFLISVNIELILRNILTNFTKLDLPEDYDKQKLETQ